MLLSRLRSTHEFPQAVSLAGHESTQVPSEQANPETQTLPQLPQLAGSVCVLTQTLLQLVWPAAHETTQLPPRHEVPPGQTWPQVPQLSLSLTALTQLVPHKICPEGQPHCPFVQIWPALQAFPQAPQLAGSLRTSTQQGCSSSFLH